MYCRVTELEMLGRLPPSPVSSSSLLALEHAADNDDDLQARSLWTQESVTLIPLSETHCSLRLLVAAVKLCWPSGAGRRLSTGVERMKADKAEHIRRGYNNEKETGETVSNSGLSKGDVWVTSKRELDRISSPSAPPEMVRGRGPFVGLQG